MSKMVNISSVARSLVLAGHLLYASHSCALRVSSCDMSGTNLHGALASHVPGQAPPSLHHCKVHIPAHSKLVTKYK